MHDVTTNGQPIDPDLVAALLRLMPGKILDWTELVHPGFERIELEQEPGHAHATFAKKVRWGFSPTVMFDLWLAADRASADDAYGELLSYHESVIELTSRGYVSLGLRLPAERAVVFDGKMDRQQVTWIDFQFGYVVGKISALAVPQVHVLDEANRLVDVVVVTTGAWVLKHQRLATWHGGCVVRLALTALTLTQQIPTDGDNLKLARNLVGPAIRTNPVSASGSSEN